jgi:hypothetical protein
MNAATELCLDEAAGRKRATFFAPIPGAVWAIAIAAALLHIAPYWLAQSRTPAGWTFTGNIHDSIDFIQYRQWIRQSQSSGIFVDDRFTGEPNRRHLPVLLYYVLGRISRVGDWAPELVIAYAGCVLAVALTVLLFMSIRHFMQDRYRTWWVFAVVVAGGGLGAHYKLLARFQAVRNNLITRRLFVEPIWDPNVLVFEDYRGHYVFTTFFDTHYLFTWLITLAALMCFYFALRRASLARSASAALLFSLATFVHIYEGPLLAGIAAITALLCRRKGVIGGGQWIAAAAAAAAALGTLVVLFMIQRGSGLPFPSWREHNVVASMLFIAYPIAWVIIARGLVSYWRGAGLDECFLLGWAGICMAMTLSGPFYPYPDRGTMTLQVPIYIIAGLIYFSRRARVRPAAALAAIAVLAPTPVWAVLRWEPYLRFNTASSFMFTSAAHRRILDALKERAGADDILASEEHDVLWLAPEYRGRHYCAHFFLTTNFERKKAEMTEFFAEPAAHLSFLEHGARFLFVGRDRGPGRFAAIPGMTLLRDENIGALFEYAPNRPPDAEHSR